MLPLCNELALSDQSYEDVNARSAFLYHLIFLMYVRFILIAIARVTD